MSTSTLKTGAIAVLALGAALFQPAAQAQTQPPSVQSLFNRLPKMPATLQEADRLGSLALGQPVEPDRLLDQGRAAVQHAR